MEKNMSGNIIKSMREKKELSQQQLADILGVSDRAVSLWESGAGFPDISLWPPLGQTLGVSPGEFTEGISVPKVNRTGNLLRSKFYTCPVCGNIIWAAGETQMSCCGLAMQALAIEEANAEHSIQVERVEDERLISLDHPMTKSHYIRFLAFVTGDRAEIVRLYPEQSAEARFSIWGSGVAYAYCNHHGLYSLKV